jgi:hypothetical protein
MKDESLLENKHRQTNISINITNKTYLSDGNVAVPSAMVCSVLIHSLFVSSVTPREVSPSRIDR